MSAAMCRTWFITVIACLTLARPAAAQLVLETVQVFNGSNGAYPKGPMVQAADGWIYGITSHAAPPGMPEFGPKLFRFDPQDPVGTFETFWEGSVIADAVEGGLVPAGDGNIYFVLQGAGYCYQGLVFRLTPPATVTPIYEECSLQGIRLRHGMTVGADGALYETLQGGGSNGTGGVYRLGLDGGFSLVASFPATFAPFAANNQLVTGTDGLLYGTWQWPNSSGLFYRVDPVSGAVDVLHEFGSYASSFDGYVLIGRLLEVPPMPGQDIALVGVTQQGGLYGYGLVYRIDLSGDVATFTRLYEGNPFGGTGAWDFKAGLVRDADGNLYGTTFNGRVYRIAPDGTFSILAFFGYAGTEEIPSWAPLLLATDGNIYGTTYANSAGPPPMQSLGSVFRLKHPSQDPLTVDAPVSAIFGTTFSVTASGGSGMGAVTFAAAGACANTGGGALVTMTSGSGFCTITATKDGDATYGPATSPAATVTAEKANQTITFGPLADKTLGDLPFSVAATGGASGNPVTFMTTTPSVCTSSGADGGTITLAAAGTCTVRASQAGDANYNAAAAVEQSFLVQGGATFAGLFDPWNPPGPGTYNGMTFTSGRAYKMNSMLPVVWGYSINGALVDSSRATSAQYPVVNIYGPLGTCSDIDGTGNDTVVSYTGPGSSTTTYDPASNTWQRNVKLDGSFQGDKCYIIQVHDPVGGNTSPSFPFKTKR